MGLIAAVFRPVVRQNSARAQEQLIADEVRRRREEARRLRIEAETEWQAAKRWFEEELLGGTEQ